jgi:hypothetical protein
VVMQLPRLLISAQLSASGRPGLNATAGVVELGLVVATLMLAQPDTLPVVVAFWVLREAVGTGLVSVLLHRQRTVALADQWRPTLPALVGMVCAMAAVWGLRQGAVPADWAAWVRVLPLAAVGIAAFGLGVVVADRHLPARCLRLLKRST